VTPAPTAGRQAGHSNRQLPTNCFALPRRRPDIADLPLLVEDDAPCTRRPHVQRADMKEVTPKSYGSPPFLLCVPLLTSDCHSTKGNGSRTGPLTRHNLMLHSSMEALKGSDEQQPSAKRSDA
jgi:hypothetical protein